MQGNSLIAYSHCQLSTGTAYRLYFPAFPFATADVNK